jgi:MYXO-CTERM domain-containing protein
VFLGSASQVVVTSVPEPATTTVAGIALLAIGGLLRLRRPASSAG